MPWRANRETLNGGRGHSVHWHNMQNHSFGVISSGVRYRAALSVFDFLAPWTKRRTPAVKKHRDVFSTQGAAPREIAACSLSSRTGQISEQISQAPRGGEDGRRGLQLPSRTTYHHSHGEDCRIVFEHGRLLETTNGRIRAFYAFRMGRGIAHTAVLCHCRG